MRRKAPAGVFYHRPDKADESIIGARVDDVTVVRFGCSPWAYVVCDHGHETAKERSRLRRRLAGKETSAVRCGECTRIRREVVAAE